MKISVIIPVYNVEQYIERCLKSVMAQTYKGDIECIVVDDCGNDRSIAIAKDVIAGYSGDIDFRIIHHEKNKGLSGARNTGIGLAVGDYVYYLDSDDDIVPECIELLVEKAQMHDGVDVVQGATLTLPDDDAFYSIKRYSSEGYVDDNAWIRHEFYRINEGLPVNAWNKLIRRDFIVDNQLYFREGVIHEDQHWMYFATKKMSTIAFVQEVTYRHYRNEESIMKSSGEEKSNRNWGLILEDVINDLHKEKESEVKNLALCKYGVILVSRYSDTDIYRDVYEKYLSMVIESGDCWAVNILKFWHSINVAPTRVLARRYLKTLAKNYY